MWTSFVAHVRLRLSNPYNSPIHGVWPSRTSSLTRDSSSTILRTASAANRQGHSLRFHAHHELHDCPCWLHHSWPQQPCGDNFHWSSSSMGRPSVARGPAGCAVPASSALESVAWSTRGAPAWRTVSRGLCVEGVCNNPACEAKGHVVICSLGCTTLDMVAPHGRGKCPCCSNVFAPIKVAFNNCEWTLEGVKMERPGARAEAVPRLEWETVGNTYAHFKPDPTDQTIWLRLNITTRKPGTVEAPAPAPAPPQPVITSNEAQAQLANHLQPPRPITDLNASRCLPGPLVLPAPQPPSTGSNQVVCSICCGEPFSRFGATAINTPCGHCYHRACLKPWVQRGRGDCPTCRRDISCLMPQLLLQS